MTLLSVEGVSAEYRQGERVVRALRDVSLQVGEGEAVGLAGESGSGKSTLAMVPLRLLPGTARVTAGTVRFEGINLLGLATEALRPYRGGRLAMVFQDPFSALNPVLPIGDQVEEVLWVHRGRRDRARVLALFSEVRLPEPERMYRSYPHQLSGGQRQRVCLAMALAGDPQLLIADEPTTALDVTVQREILDLLDGLRKSRGMAVLFVTHNLGLLSERTDRLAILYAGQVVEEGPTVRVLREPSHPYTQGLLASLPRLSGRENRLPTLAGQPPDLARLPSGCAFHPRCPKVFAPCQKHDPALKSMETDHAGPPRAVACHLIHEPPQR